MVWRSSSVMSCAKVAREGMTRNTNVAMILTLPGTRLLEARAKRAEDSNKPLTGARGYRRSLTATVRRARVSSSAHPSLDCAFGQADDVALGVSEESKGQSEARNLRGRNHGRASQLFRHFQILRRVV